MALTAKDERTKVRELVNENIIEAKASKFKMLILGSEDELGCDELYKMSSIQNSNTSSDQDNNKDDDGNR